jgi:hypothetical protein
MKTIISLLFVSLLSQANASTIAAPGKIGAGLMIGSMFSVTGKYWLSGRDAIDFGIGFGIGKGTLLYGDYLWHVPGIFGKTTQFGRETSGYVGGGAGLGFWSDSYDCGRWKCDQRTTDSGTGVFLRGVVGFEWYPIEPPKFGFFAELGPTILLIPSTSGTFDIGIGGRYYF